MKKRLWPKAIIIFLAVVIVASGFILRDQLALGAQIARLTAELNRDPQNFDAAFGLGVAYFRNKDYSKSVEYYTKATEINAGSPEAFNNLGNTYRKLLRFEDAEKAYSNALAVAPVYTTTYVNLAGLYAAWPEDKGDRSSEIPTLLEKGLEATEDSPILLRELISYYRKIGDLEKAEEYQGRLDT